jgi:hypothetical protein
MSFGGKYEKEKLSRKKEEKGKKKRHLMFNG